jgi:hypothetical protein
MRIAAFSTRTGAATVVKVTGVTPIMFPPETMKTFRPAWLNGYDFLYFHLHGLPHQPFWYGNGWITAISSEQIEQCDLRGCSVFVSNCFGLDGRMESAILNAGARAIVTGPGKNDAGKGGWVRGADLLGALYLRGCMAGLGDEDAFKRARQSLRLRALALISPSERDALEFQLKLKRSTA